MLDEAGEPVVGVFVGAAMRILVAGVERFASGPFARTDDRGAYRLAPLVPGAYVVVVPVMQFSTAAALPALRLVDSPFALFPGEPVGYLPDGRLTTRMPTPTPSLAPGQHAVQTGDAGYVVRGPGSLPPAPAGADGRRLGYAPAFYPGAPSIDRATRVHLGPGVERGGIDIVLTPVPVYRLSGAIDLPTGAEGPQRVRLVPLGSENLGTGYEAATALTTPDGRFSFLEVPEGRYSIAAGSNASYVYQPPGGQAQPALRALASLAGGWPATLGGSSSSASEVALVPGEPVNDAQATVRRVVDGARLPWRVLPSPVEIAGADLDGVRVEFGARWSVSGRLVIDSPQDLAALDARSTSLRVVAESADAMGGGGQATVPLTGSLLDFRFGGLPPGEYLLRMFGGTGFIKSVALGGRDYTGVPIGVTGDLGGLVVTVTSQRATLEGTVREPEGEPARYAAVVYFPTDPGRWRHYGPRPDRLGSVPVRNGRYAIALPGGEYFLVAVDAGFADSWKDPAFLESAAPRATRAAVAWSESAEHDLVFHDTASAAGIVSGRRLEAGGLR